MIRSKLVKTCLGIGVIVAGCLFQGSCAGAVANVNPCGTIFSTEFCDPVAYERLFGNAYEADYDVDPTCVVAFGCEAGEL